MNTGKILTTLGLVGVGGAALASWYLASSLDQKGINPEGITATVNIWNMIASAKIINVTLTEELSHSIQTGINAFSCSYAVALLGSVWFLGEKVYKLCKSCEPTVPEGYSFLADEEDNQSTAVHKKNIRYLNKAHESAEHRIDMPTSEPSEEPTIESQENTEPSRPAVATWNT